MMHGTLQGGDYLTENGDVVFDDEYCNGIYLQGIPAEKFGSLTSFASLGMHYNEAQTQDGTINQPAGDWYLWDQIIPSPAGDGLKLKDLNDVDAAAPNDGDVIRFDASKQQWVTATAGGDDGGSFSGIKTYVGKVHAAERTQNVAIAINGPETGKQTPPEVALVNRSAPSTNDSFYGCQLADMSQVVCAYMLSMTWGDKDRFNSSNSLSNYNFSVEIPQVPTGQGGGDASEWSNIIPTTFSKEDSESEVLTYRNSYSPYFATGPGYWNPAEGFAAPELDGPGELTVNFQYETRTFDSNMKTLVSYQRVAGFPQPGEEGVPETVYGWEIVLRETSSQMCVAVDILVEDEFGFTRIEDVLSSSRLQSLLDFNIANGGGGGGGGGGEPPARAGEGITPKYVLVNDINNVIMVHELDTVENDGTYRWRLIINGICVDEVAGISEYDWYAAPGTNTPEEGRPRIGASGVDQGFFIKDDAVFIDQNYATSTSIWGFWATRTSVFKIADLRVIDPDTFQLSGPPLYGGLNGLYGDERTEPDGNPTNGPYLNYLGFDCFDYASYFYGGPSVDYTSDETSAFLREVKGTHPALHPVYAASSNQGQIVTAQDVDTGEIVQFKNESPGWSTSDPLSFSGFGNKGWGAASYSKVGITEATQLTWDGKTWGDPEGFGDGINTLRVNNFPITQVDSNDELYWNWTEFGRDDLKPENFKQTFNLSVYYGDNYLEKLLEDSYYGYAGQIVFADKRFDNFYSRIPTRAIPYGNPLEPFRDNGNEPDAERAYYQGPAAGGRFYYYQRTTSFSEFSAATSGRYFYDSSSDYLYIHTKDLDNRVLQLDSVKEMWGRSLPVYMTLADSRATDFRARWLPVVANDAVVAGNPIGSTPIANAIAVNLIAGDYKVFDENADDGVRIDAVFDGSDSSSYPALNSSDALYLSLVMPERHPHEGEVLIYNGVSTYQAQDGNTLAGLPLGPKTPRYEFVPCYGDTDFGAAVTDGETGLIGFPSSNNAPLYITNVDYNGETVDLSPWINNAASTNAQVNILRTPFEFGLITPDGSDLGSSARFAPVYESASAASVHSAFSTSGYWLGENTGLPNSLVGWSFPCGFSSVNQMFQAMALRRDATFMAALRTAGYRIYLRPILDWKVVQDGDSLTWNDAAGYWEIGSGGGALGRSTQAELLAEIEKDPEAFRKALGL